MSDCVALSNGSKRIAMVGEEALRQDAVSAVVWNSGAQRWAKANRKRKVAITSGGHAPDPDMMK